MTRIARAPWQKPKPIVGGRKRAKSEIDPVLRQVVYSRAGGCCECCGERLGQPWQAHHRKLRSRGGQDSVCNLLALCGLCHRRVHGRPVWSTEQGFMVSAFEDPARCPVAIRGEEWRYLTLGGQYLPTNDSAYDGGYFPAGDAS